MKARLIAAGLFLLLVSITAHATSIDLGPSRVFTYKDVLNGDYGIFRNVTSFGLDGRVFDGQTISYNVTFGGNFIRAFHDTQELFVRTDLTVAAGVPFPTHYFGFNVGSAYFLNKNGGKASNRFSLEGSFEGYRDVWDIAIFGGKTLANRPRDVYGFHIDLNFNYPGLVLDEDRIVTNSFGDSFPLPDDVNIEATGKHNKNVIFGVGPKLPTDIVPESGSTAAFMGMALAGMAWFSWKQKPQHVCDPVLLRLPPV
jgi:hypothetical protein